MPLLTHRLAFRWMLPLVQLLTCFLILLPVRGRLLLGIAMSAHAYAPEKETAETLTQAGSIRVILPPTSEEQRMEKQSGHPISRSSGAGFCCGRCGTTVHFTEPHQTGMGATKECHLKPGGL